MQSEKSDEDSVSLSFAKTLFYCKQIVYLIRN